jgi:hypothetical protein
MDMSQDEQQMEPKSGPVGQTEVSSIRLDEKCKNRISNFNIIRIRAKMRRGIKGGCAE